MTPPTITTARFGTMPGGREILEWTLVASTGMTARVLNYGGIVRALEVPLPNGGLRDVVLGMGTWEEYAAGHPFLGTITGRIAGRVPGGRISFGGRTLQLELNDGVNHLHGGRTGLDKRIWSGRPFLTPDGGAGLELTYFSPDGEEGYPGNMEITVTYELTSACGLKVLSKVSCDQTSPACLTHHSYFQLAGDGDADILDHELRVLADEAFDVDTGDLTPTCRLASVAGTGLDLRSSRLIRDVLPAIPARHGGLYQLTANPGGAMLEAARVLHRPSGLGMRVSTNEACLQLYLGMALDGTLRGKSGHPIRAHAGICLECQGHPDAAGHPEIGDILVRPGEPMIRRTVYEFFHIDPAQT